jgi:hypothetical protein
VHLRLILLAALLLLLLLPLFLFMGFLKLTAEHSSHTTPQEYQ